MISPRWILSALALLLSVLLVACNTATIQQPLTKLTTSADSPELPKEFAKRVVALSSLSTDIIYKLDKTKLVGITGSKLFKDDSRFTNIPRVSEGQSPPNLEKIIALQPDLVIGAEGFSNQPIQKLQQLGISTLLTKVNSWESLEKLTRQLAKLINADPQPLLNSYKSFVADKPTDSPSTLVIVSRQPILAPNKNSWAGDLLTKFQAKNLVAELQEKSPISGYVTLSAEKVLQANPDILIVVNDTDPQLLNSLKKEAFWQQLQATKNNRVYTFNYYGLVNPGSIDAIKKACQQLTQALSASART